MRLGAIFAGAVLVLMAGGIFAQLLVLQDSNDRIHAQDEKIGDLRADAEPILDTLRPLLDETGPVLREAGPALQEARRLAGPLGETADDVSAALEPAPQLVRGVLALVGRTLPVVDMLQATMPEVRTLMSELRAVLPAASEFLDEAARRELLRRADAAVSATLHIESIQVRSLRTIRRQLAIQEETLAIQKQALEHIESLDRKTGGEFPPGAGG
jgi:ABC-type transporter Mla subunit MlaD